MAYIKPSETDTLPLPSDSQYTVTLKRRATYGDIEAARSAMIKVDAQLSSQTPTIDTKVEYALYQRALLLRLIVGWNLTDLQERPLPITAASLEILDPIDGEFLQKECAIRSSIRPQVQEVPFEKPSGDS